MTEIERQIDELTKQLQELRGRQMQMNNEMVLAERKLDALKTAILTPIELEKITEKAVAPQPTIVEPAVPYIIQAKRNAERNKAVGREKSFRINGEMEDFIGTNVISKIGILVTVVGVFIGAKYAIDNELIGASMRIIAGYACGTVLIFISLKLKSKYEYFSSILIGGGLAVTYFITYIAYSFYLLFPLAMAFALMIITTAAAVGIAIWYNEKIIAILGQVAAYAIPFLLSSGSGNIFILFSYITVINFGLLILSFKKDWKILYHIAFFLTWLIYGFSTVIGNRVTGNFSAGLALLTINFFTFYVTFLSYKIVKKELYNTGEVAILLFNALFFFFLGIYLVSENFQGQRFPALFTIGNACVHITAGYFIYRLRLVDKSVFQFILGLGLLFFTIVIPIEFNGNWVTLLWSLEATSLFYVAAKSSRQLYFDIALPLIVISFLSLLHDWHQNYPLLKTTIVSADFNLMPFININFILSLLACACFGYMSFAFTKVSMLVNTFTTIFFSRILPVAFLLILYFALYNELHFSWDKTIHLNIISGNSIATKIYEPLRQVSLFIYSFIYIAIWFFINSYLIKSERLHPVLLLSSVLVNVVFLLGGLYIIGELREQYLSKTALSAQPLLLYIRYLSFAALALLWLAAIKELSVFKPSYDVQRVISTIFNFTLLSIISNEFIHWMDLSGYQNQYKLGLSLICGGYALALLFAGIIKNKKHLRISAIVLFAGTLLKLFFYDLASLTTISKTIVLMLLGILLLFASFLYNKYKDLLFTKDEVTKEGL